MSEPAYDHRYSDRDVRENPDLRDLALDYIDKYGGSFEPLLRIKNYMASGEDYEPGTSQIRMILNCMRNDVAVAATLPAPQFPYTVPKGGFLASPKPMGQVIPMQRDRRSKPQGKQDCGNKESHSYHGLGYGSWCEGVPFQINRHYSVRTKGRLHTMHFAVSKSGALVHKMTGEATFIWRPNQHDWGFAADHPVEVNVKTNCKNPSWVSGGHLFEEEPVHLYADDAFAKSRCIRCFSASELRKGPVIPRQRAHPVIFLPPEIS